MTTHVNKIGLEAEFLVRDKNSGHLLFPQDHGFSTDEYIILGEFRAEPGTTISETISNFMKEYYNILSIAEKEGVVIEISGHSTVNSKFNAEIMRRMGVKRINDSQNIYGTDILQLSDDIIENGTITGKRISCGLHIHFSSYVHVESSFELTYNTNEFIYSKVEIPLNFGKDINTSITLYRQDKNPSYNKDGRKTTIHADASRITKPVIEFFVKEFDKKVLPKYIQGLPPLKYRSKGFYELKNWGFEYRSLPFNKNVLDNLFDIVRFSFELLNNL